MKKRKATIDALVAKKAIENEQLIKGVNYFFCIEVKASIQPIDFEKKRPPAIYTNVTSLFGMPVTS